MTSTIRLEGSNDLQAALRGMGDDISDAVGKAVVGTALELRGNIVKDIHGGPASGRVYQKYNPARTHQASAPGEAPMSDTGRLASSIFFDQEGPLTAIVGSALAYSLYLEYGTSRMSARPFFRPAVEEIRLKFEARLRKAIEGALK